jgi:AcrR family transcriptional regulator
LCETAEKTRTRGRPKAYDPEKALDQAAALFWERGFDGTSLDDLGTAMGMGRPSIYNAFGDKEALFVRALERFRETTGFSPVRAMDAQDSIRDALDAFFRQLVEYTTDDASPRGCLLGSVAPGTTIPQVHVFLRENLTEIELLIAQRLTTAIERGQLPADYAPKQGARRAINAMLALGARARLGTPREELLADAADATSILLAGDGRR